MCFLMVTHVKGLLNTPTPRGGHDSQVENHCFTWSIFPRSSCSLGSFAAYPSQCLVLSKLQDF